MSFKHLRVEEWCMGQATRLVLDSPPGNVLTISMMKELSQQIKKEEDNPDKKLLTIAGEGKHFSYGASVEEHQGEQVEEMLKLFHLLVGQIISCPIPTAAEVSGFCLGGGFELALGCTFLFADEKAVFGLPEISLGVYPPVALAIAPEKAPALLGRMAITGEKVDAKTLQEADLVTASSSGSDLSLQVEEYFNKHFRNKSASSLRIAHRLMRKPMSERYGKRIQDLESVYLDELMKTKDATEGIKSYLEKRKPEWQNV